MSGHGAAGIKTAVGVHEASEAGRKQASCKDQGDADGDFESDQGTAQTFAGVGLASQAGLGVQHFGRLGVRTYPGGNGSSGKCSSGGKQHSAGGSSKVEMQRSTEVEFSRQKTLQDRHKGGGKQDAQTSAK